MAVSHESESLYPACSLISGNDPRNKALAGTGNPINEVVCRVSRLNLASLTAESTGIIKAINEKILSNEPAVGVFGLATISWYIIIPGKTPNETTSARESSSFPISLFTCSNRAAMPSIKSNSAAIAIK